VSTSAAPLEWLLSAAAIDSGLDRKMLAGLLLELARNVDANIDVDPTGIVPFDPRLEQLRTLLLGREIGCRDTSVMFWMIPGSWHRRQSRSPADRPSRGDDGSVNAGTCFGSSVGAIPTPSWTSSVR
jgi:hypothetical protein